MYAQVAAWSQQRLPAGQLWADLQDMPDERWKFLVADRYERSGYSPWAYVSLFLLVLSAGSLVIFTGSLWGLFSAYRTARVITHENNRDTLDLLAITPVGASGVFWLIFKLTVHYDIDLGQFVGLRRLGLSVLCFPLLLFTGIIGAVALANPEVLTNNVLSLFAIWIALVPMVYLDPVYGLISGGLVAMLVTTYFRTDAYMVAMSGFISGHILITVLSFLPAIILTPAGDALLMNSGFWRVLLIPLLINGIYIFLHESIIWLLRWGLQKRVGVYVL